MLKRWRTKAARRGRHQEMMQAFIEFLEEYWPLWRQHVGEPRYHDMLAAFKAGWLA